MISDEVGIKRLITYHSSFITRRLRCYYANAAVWAKAALELPGAQLRGVVAGPGIPLSVDINEALKSVRVALDLGMNFIDTSPYHGRGMSEVLSGVALRVAAAAISYILGTKLGRYDVGHFDFSARRVAESVDVSLHRMGVEHLDIVLCHDIEYVDMWPRSWKKRCPRHARPVQQQGKVRYVGISGYPMKIFQYVLERAPLDCMLSYNQYTLQNRRLADIIPFLESKGVGIAERAARSHA